MDEKEKNIVIKAINAYTELESIIGQPYTEGEIYELLDNIRPLVDRWMPKMMCVDELKSDIKIGCVTFEKGTTVIAKCPTCGNWVRKSDKYCGECGQALAPDERGKTFSWENAVEAGEEFCPIIGERVMTYYAKDMPAFYRYTPPFVDNRGGISWCRYDEDEGDWENVIFVEMEMEGYQYLRLIGKEPEISL